MREPGELVSSCGLRSILTNPVRVVGHRTGVFIFTPPYRLKEGRTHKQRTTAGNRRSCMRAKYEEFPVMPLDARFQSRAQAFMRYLLSHPRAQLPRRPKRGTHALVALGLERVAQEWRHFVAHKEVRVLHAQRLKKFLSERFERGKVRRVSSVCCGYMVLSPLGLQLLEHRPVNTD